MAATYPPSAGGALSPDEPGRIRVVDTTAHAEIDPAEPWELPAGSADLEELATRRFARLPHRPATLDEVPPRAVTDLRRAVGDLRTERVFLVPRAARTPGKMRSEWVLTPTQVIAVGDGALAVWVDDPDGEPVTVRVPFPEIEAILDRNILLYGRLEIIGANASIVVRYNAVGRPELRQLLLPVRRAAARMAPPPAGGADPGELPHKWMALLRSTEVQPLGTDSLLVAAGDLADPAPRLHNGVAVLSSRELLVATDPTSDPRDAHYGVDLLAVPRSRVTWVGGIGTTLRVGVEATPLPLEIRVTADPSLVAAATTILGPVIEQR